MNPSSKPACPEKMIAIATFQNLVIDKTLQEEIARQTDPGSYVPPSFGNTWDHKITLLNPVVRSAMIDAISIIPNLVFNIPALVTMFSIWKQTSIKVLFSRIIAAAATITGLKWLIFFATTWIIGHGLKKVLTKSVGNTIARFKATKENSILDDLAKKNEWWKDEEGKSVYKRHRKAEAQLERACIATYEKFDFRKWMHEGGVPLFEETAGFAYKHAKTIVAIYKRPLTAFKVHIWDDKFSDMVAEEDRIKSMQTVGELADGLANERICKTCSKHVDNIANAIIRAQDAE